MPQVSYAQATCADHDTYAPFCHNWVFPYFPNDGGTGWVVPAVPRGVINSAQDIP